MTKLHGPVNFTGPFSLAFSFRCSVFSFLNSAFEQVGRRDSSADANVADSWVFSDKVKHWSFNLQTLSPIDVPARNDGFCFRHLMPPAGSPRSAELLPIPLRLAAPCILQSNVPFN
jgi:hypothetical protein